MSGVKDENGNTIKSSLKELPASSWSILPSISDSLISTPIACSGSPLLLPVLLKCRQNYCGEMECTDKYFTFAAYE
jgi:hypothetical protein